MCIFLQKHEAVQIWCNILLLFSLAHIFLLLVVKIIKFSRWRKRQISCDEIKSIFLPVKFIKFNLISSSHFSQKAVSLFFINLWHYNNLF